MPTAADLPGADTTLAERAAPGDNQRLGCNQSLAPRSNAVAAMQTTDVEIANLTLPSSQPFADPSKLQRHGPFDWNKYTPIIVETDGTHSWLTDGVTRTENARRAGITKLPAYVFPRR